MYIVHCTLIVFIHTYIYTYILNVCLVLPLFYLCIPISWMLIVSNFEVSWNIFIFDIIIQRHFIKYLIHIYTIHILYIQHIDIANFPKLNVVNLPTTLSSTNIDCVGWIDNWHSYSPLSSSRTDFIRRDQCPMCLACSTRKRSSLL